MPDISLRELQNGCVFIVVDSIEVQFTIYLEERVFIRDIFGGTKLMGSDIFSVADPREFNGHERMKYTAPNATL